MNIKIKNAIVAAILAGFVGMGSAKAESSFQCDRLEALANDMMVQRMLIKNENDFLAVVEGKAKATSDNNYKRKVYIGLGVFTALSQRNGKLMLTDTKIKEMCEKVGYEKTEEMLHDFGSEYLEIIGE